jgi:hypothetical protein
MASDINFAQPHCAIFALYSDIHETMEDWNARKAKLREKFTKLGEANAMKQGDGQEQLISRLQKRIGASREVILKLLSELQIS